MSRAPCRLAGARPGASATSCRSATSPARSRCWARSSTRSPRAAPSRSRSPTIRRVGTWPTSAGGRGDGNGRAPNRRCPVGGTCNSGARVDTGRAGRYIRAMSNEADTDLLDILIAPNPLLKARARPVTGADADTVRDLVPRLFATMYRAPGIGLAAPQVGTGLRLAVVDLMPNNARAPIILINPEVAATSEELATREEGCLSLPGQYAEITRPARVRVRYLDQTGARQEIEAEGLLAAC